MGDEGEEEDQKKVKRKGSPMSGRAGPTSSEGSGVRDRKIGGKWCEELLHRRSKGGPWFCRSSAQLFQSRRPFILLDKN